MVTEEDIISGQMAHERSPRETKMVNRSVLKIPSNIASVLDEDGIA